MFQMAVRQKWGGFISNAKAVQRDNKGIHHVVLVVMRTANTGGS